MYISLYRTAEQLEQDAEILSSLIVSERWDMALHEAEDIVFAARMIAAKITDILRLQQEEKQREQNADLMRRYESDRNAGQGLDAFNEDYGTEESEA